MEDELGVIRHRYLKMSGVDLLKDIIRFWIN